MSEAELSTRAPALSELALGLEVLQTRIEAIGQQVEMQGEIQLEIAKLLQSLHGGLQSIPEQLIDGIDLRVEQRDRDKIAVTKEVLVQLDTRLTQLLTGVHAVKQTSNLALRELRANARVVRAVFVVQSIAMWDALVGVYEAMIEDPRFHPLVVSINHSHLGRGDFEGEADVHLALNAMGVPHIRLDLSSIDAADVLRNLRPDVVFRQQQWDMPVPPGLRTHEITYARICVVPYGMGVLANPDGKDEADEAYHLNYDQVYHRLAWKVFCETEKTQSYYQSFQHSDPEKFVLSGYPKLDRLLEARGQGVWPVESGDGRGYRVIWAPHHSLVIQGAGFGVFHLICKQMYEWAQSSPDIQFVLKPHPALAFTATRTGAMAPEGYDAFVAKWSALPNCAVCEGDYAKLFDASDLMVTDGVAFLTEYHLFEKPIIFFDSGIHAPFNALGRLGEQASHRVEDFDGMKQAVLDYKSGKSWPLEQERKALLDVLLPSETPASQVILNSIYDGIHLSRS